MESLLLLLMFQCLSTLLLILAGFCGLAQQPIFKLEGRVTDVHLGGPLMGVEMSLYSTLNADPILHYTDSNGMYAFDTDSLGQRLILPEVEYRLEVNAMEVAQPDGCRYLGAISSLSTVGVLESSVFQKDFHLQSANCCYEIPLPLIYFDSELGYRKVGHNASDTLNTLYGILVDNPTIIMEIASHCYLFETEQANRACSEKRADQIAKTLIDRGIDPERFVPVGYGDTRPKISEREMMEMTEIQKNAARGRNERCVFSVLSYDYVPE